MKNPLEVNKHMLFDFTQISYFYLETYILVAVTALTLAQRFTEWRNKHQFI